MPLPPASSFRRALATLALVAAIGGASTARAAQDVAPREWLVLPPIDVPRREPFPVQTFFARMLARHDALPPQHEERLKGELGVEQEFARRVADEHGNVACGRMAGAFAEVEMPDERVLLAELTGASALYVNGFPQVGDVYGNGGGGLPVLLQKGRNVLVVTGGRGESFHLRLAPAAAPLLVNPFDATCGDLIVGELVDAGARADPRLHGNAAVLLVNATNAPLEDVVLETGGSEADGDHGPFQPWRSKLSVPIAPRGILKVPIVVRPAPSHPMLAKAGTVKVEIRASARAHGEVAAPIVATSTLELNVVAPRSLHRRTYVSDVDGSVQPYAVLPPTGKASGLVLTLHGAGVECAGQAAAYSAKPDLWIVAPTNRRRFGFDWQDWGRRDAYDVLERALALTGVDSDHVYLTGHSMGGHGTWHLAANDPDCFAAIAPSAGWASFSTYVERRARTSEWSEIWRGADRASDTLALLDNLRAEPIYILHGEDDDNVPIREAKTLLAALQQRGASPQFHFQEKAGHWWDGDAAPGADCVDWPPIFELFRKTVRTTPLAIDFTTVDPGIDSDHAWLSVEQPLEYGKPIHVTASWDAATRTATLTTQNARRLQIRAPDGRGPIHGVIDGTRLEAVSDPAAARGSANSRSFVHAGDGWHESSSSDSIGEKSPRRSGPFKRAFDRDFVLVYGTKGDEAQDRELFERARYDASVWWYRANGCAPLLSDEEFLDRCEEDGARARRWRTCNVILYGNRDTNGAWDAVLDDDVAIRAKNGEIEVGPQRFRGSDLAAVFVAPRARYRLRDRTRHETALELDPMQGLVGAFADSGAIGTRLGYTLLPFTSGVGYPDYVIFGSNTLTLGDGGVLAAGWFDAKWRIPGEH